MSNWLKNNAVALVCVAMIGFFMLQQQKNNNSPSSPTTKSDPALVKKATESMKAYVASVSRAYEETAKKIEAGELKTVMDAAAFSVAIEEEGRKAWKTSIAEMMEPKIGSGPIEPKAGQVLRDISVGYTKAMK